MRKNEFLKELKKRLDFFQKGEQEEVVNYYEELIQDALDHGESEHEFIDQLGPIEDIIVNIKKDGTFFEKVRSKMSFPVSEVFGVTVKVIGYFFFAIFAITMLSIGFSFMASGASVIVYSIIQIFMNLGQEIVVTLLRLCQILVGAGILIFGIAIWKWFFEVSKTTLKQLLKKVQNLLN
jgi:hypothetical protein